MNKQNFLNNSITDFLVFFIILLFLITSCNKGKHSIISNSSNPIAMDSVNFMPSNPTKDGYIPNVETAVRVAEAIWLPIYGNGIYKNKPFNAELINDSIWIVTGTVHTDFGGAPYAEIRKSDCKVIKITHYK